MGANVPPGAAARAPASGSAGGDRRLGSRGRGLPQALARGAPVRAFRLDRSRTARLTEAHAHKHFELVYFTTPAGTRALGEHAWVTRAGDLLLIAPVETHGWDPRGLAADADARIVRFEARALGARFADTAAHAARHPLLRAFARGGGPLRVPAGGRARFAGLLARLARELAGDGDCAAEAARACLTLLLADASRYARAQRAPADERAGGASHGTVARVLDVIERQYHQPISLADVAAALGRARKPRRRHFRACRKLKPNAEARRDAPRCAGDGAAATRRRRSVLPPPVWLLSAAAPRPEPLTSARALNDFSALGADFQ